MGWLRRSIVLVYRNIGIIVSVNAFHYSSLMYTSPILTTLSPSLVSSTDFMPQFEVGQQELIDIHHYTYLIDLCSLGKAPERLAKIVYDVNSYLVGHIYFSTQNRNNYHKMMSRDQFGNTKRYMSEFCKNFLTVEWFSEYVGLGFSEINPKEKDINSLTQTGEYQCNMALKCAARDNVSSFLTHFHFLSQLQCFTETN
jgi:hypothetical protein